MTYGVYIPHVCWRYSSMARKPGPLHSLTGGDWIYSTHNVNGGSFLSDGTITSLIMKSYVEPVSSRPHLLFANEGLDYSVMLPDSLMMSQQTRYFGPATKLKMVSGHHPTGGVLEVDLPSPGFIRSAGTREYRWPMLWSWQKTDRFGDKSQQWDATADDDDDVLLMWLFQCPLSVFHQFTYIVSSQLVIG